MAEFRKHQDANDGQQHEADDETIAEEEYSGDSKGKQKGYADHQSVALPVKLYYSPDKDRRREHHIEKRAAVEAQIESIDKQEFKLLGHFDETGHESVKHHYDDGE